MTEEKTPVLLWLHRPPGRERIRVLVWHKEEWYQVGQIHSVHLAHIFMETLIRIVDLTVLGKNVEMRIELNEEPVRWVPAEPIENEENL